MPRLGWLLVAAVIVVLVGSCVGMDLSEYDDFHPYYSGFLKKDSSWSFYAVGRLLADESEEDSNVEEGPLLLVGFPQFSDPSHRPTPDELAEAWDDRSTDKVLHAVTKNIETTAFSFTTEEGPVLSLTAPNIADLNAWIEAFMDYGATTMTKLPSKKPAVATPSSVEEVEEEEEQQVDLDGGPALPAACPVTAGEVSKLLNELLDTLKNTPEDEGAIMYQVFTVFQTLASFDLLDPEFYDPDLGSTPETAAKYLADLLRWAATGSLNCVFGDVTSSLESSERSELAKIVQTLDESALEDDDEEDENEEDDGEEEVSGGQLETGGELGGSGQRENGASSGLQNQVEARKDDDGFVNMLQMEPNKQNTGTSYTALMGWVNLFKSQRVTPPIVYNYARKHHGDACNNVFRDTASAFVTGAMLGGGTKAAFSLVTAFGRGGLAGVATCCFVAGTAAAFHGFATSLKTQVLPFKLTGPQWLEVGNQLPAIMERQTPNLKLEDVKAWIPKAGKDKE